MEASRGRFDEAAYRATKKRKFTIISDYGYNLSCELLEPKVTENPSMQTDALSTKKAPGKKLAVLCHGFSHAKYKCLIYAEIFLKLGYTVIIYDHRNHGLSGRAFTSMGFYEKFDLNAIVDWLKNEKGSDLVLGIHGESMGAATMLLYAGMLKDGADFYIADCPFSDLKEQLKYRIKKEIKLPAGLFLSIADLLLRIRDKYSIRNVSPIAVIENIHHPILFIHSKKDDFILPSMTEELFKQKKGPKMLYFASNGLHAHSFNKNCIDYEKVIDEFLQKHIGFKPLI
jgi:fermentation-respiration switch protein FrsA (DUF1100 family)